MKLKAKNQSGLILIEAIFLIPIILMVTISSFYLTFSLFSYNNLRTSLTNLSRDISIIDPLVDLRGLVPGDLVNCVVNMQTRPMISCFSRNKKQFPVNSYGFSILDNTFRLNFNRFNLNDIAITYVISDIKDPADPVNLYLPLVYVSSKSTLTARILNLPRVNIATLKQGGRVFV